MKVFFITLLLFILSVNFGFGQAKVDTMEAHRLWVEGKSLGKDNKYFFAAKSFQKAGRLFEKSDFEVRYADCLLKEAKQYADMFLVTPKIPDLSNKALKIYQNKLGTRHLKVGILYRQLGDYYKYNLGYNERVEALFEKAAAIFKHKNNLWLAWIWNDLGNLYYRRAKYKQAIEYYNLCYQVLKILLKPNDRRFFVYFSNIGNCSLEQRKYDLAIEYYKKALSFETKKEGVFKNLGSFYLKQKKYAIALNYYKQALIVAKKRYNNAHKNIGGIYRDIGHLYLQSKNYKKALSFYQKSFSYLIQNFQDTLNIYYQTKYNISKYPFSYLRSLSGKAKTLLLLSDQVKDLKLSLYNYQNCDSLLNYLKNQRYQQYDQIILNRNYISQIYPGAIQVCERLYVKTKGEYYQHLAFYFTEKSHSNFLSRLIHAHRARSQVSLPDSVTNRELYLQQQTSYFQRKLLTIKDSIQKQTYQDSLFEYIQKREYLNKVLAKNFPKYYRLRFQNTPATVAQIQQKLDQQTVLLNYDFGKERSRVFVVTKDTFQIIPLAKQSDVTKVLNDYYNALQNEVDLKTFTVKSYEVYKTLFEPVKAFLQGKQKLVITNPTLLSVPLGAVVDQSAANPRSKFSQLPYLIKKYAISYHYSASLWLQSQEGESTTSESKRSFIGMAPFSGGESKAVTTRGNKGLLPESKKEINAIYNFFKQKNLYAEAYLAKAATKQRFLNRLKDFDILHIASHSTANLREERLAKIHFAPQTHPDSTYLYAESIYYLPLKAQLVVLSSCESGVGKFAPGEGVMSLARGFLHAGAKNVISSLWEADDQYTKKLMVLLYQQILFRHKTYTQALHTAKNQLIAQEPRLHPKYWSNFILIGR